MYQSYRMLYVVFHDTKMYGNGNYVSSVEYMAMEMVEKRMG